MKRISIAIAGAGDISQSIHIPLLHSIENARITAIYDPDKRKAAAVAGRWGIGRVCGSIDELAGEDIDAVVITARTDAHFELAIKCIEAGKDLFIEKPMARNFEEALQIHEAAENKGVKVMAGMNQRFRADAIMMKNYVQMGEIGRLFYAKAGWMQQKRGKEWLRHFEISGGGVLIDLGIFLVDSLLWIFDFTEVKSVIGTSFNHLTESVEDIFTGSIRFADGSMATIESSWSLFSNKNKFFCDVHGSKGSIKINPFRVFKNDGELNVAGLAGGRLSEYEIHRRSYENELKHFINACLGYGKIISTSSEAVKVLRVIDMLYRSAREERELNI
ncbi:MAG: Gfo/Idh/MocA family protein [Candidatus Kapaibacterium sp.]